MKNFFKKLAFVLSLAMVLVTMAPAAKASAATAPSLRTAGKILYIGGDVSGNYGETYRFKFKDSYGYTATWKAENPTVAKMSDEKNTVVAVAPGTAKFTVTLTNKAGNVVELTATVWVRQNAATVGFGSQKAIETAKTVGDTFKINVYRALENGKKVWAQSDLSTITDKIIWTSSDENVATVSKWGTVKCVGAGEATITAKAVQNQGNLESAHASYKVVVNAGITDAKVISNTKCELTFGAAVSDDVVKTLTMKNKNGVNVTSYIKKITLNDTKTVATVESYVAFQDKDVYTFAIDSLKTEFVMNVSIGTAAQIKLKAPTTVVANATDATEIKWDVLDANGVVIGSNSGDVDLSIDNLTYAYLDKNAKTIRMYKVGETVTITAKYKTNTYDSNWNEITFEDKIVVACVEKSASTLKTDLLYSVASSEPTSDAGYNANVVVPLNDYNRRLYVKATSSEDTTLKNDNFTFETLNANVLLVNPKSGKLTPIATGVAPVRVTYGSTFTTIINVTVGANAVASDISYTVSGPQTLSNAASVDEKVTFTLKVADQYGNDLGKKAVTVDVLSAPDGVNKDTLVKEFITTDDGTVTFKAADAVKGGYTFRLKTQEKSVVVSVSIVAPDTEAEPAFYQIRLSDSQLDTTVTSSTVVSDSAVTFKVVGCDAAGVAKTLVTDPAIISLAIKDSNDKAIDSAFYDGVASAGVYTVNAYGQVGTTTVSYDTKGYSKLATGTYSITGTVTAGGIQRTISPINLTVVDSQKAPTVTANVATITLSKNSTYADEASIINTLNRISGDDKLFNTPDGYKNLAITDIETSLPTGKEVEEGTYQIFVKTVTVEKAFTDTLTYTHTVNVNKLFVVTVK